VPADRRARNNRRKDTRASAITAARSTQQPLSPHGVSSSSAAMIRSATRRWPAGQPPLPESPDHSRCAANAFSEGFRLGSDGNASDDSTSSPYVVRINSVAITTLIVLGSIENNPRSNRRRMKLRGQVTAPVALNYPVKKSTTPVSRLYIAPAILISPFDSIGPAQDCPCVCLPP
jgi:hypothetical protein